ncbi:MAG: hypothetical protein N2Z62_06440 [Rhodobacteraceae bacterium]|jgi:hypothetical protein|uniref:head-tail joining protein n=1 Tax=Acetobacterales TaxID=3120395 RepID=UPI000425A91E|nr:MULTISPECIES: hypothetical protein [Rhodospirillales]MCX7644919.1 hypothetical protein [Paracoccaceae bacterium]GIX10667.1 MAG: hypothetical protein KatS3mg116_2377 [Elioraea sp.]
MNAFAEAMAALVADPNLGVEALYRQGGTGPAVAIRVLRSSPDRVGEAFGTEIVAATDILSVAIATLPGLAAGDSFALGPDLLTVTHAERDATGTAWRVFCQR